jgi:hypothetical protein
LIDDNQLFEVIELPATPQMNERTHDHTDDRRSSLNIRYSGDDSNKPSVVRLRQNPSPTPLSSLKNAFVNGISDD